MVLLPEPIQYTISAIWKAYEARSQSSDSLGINMSQAGNECSRAIWYMFRWAAPLKIPDGPARRRFGTGIREEERLLDDLEAAAVSVERLDPATGAQFKVELANGWLRGKLDGKALNLPEAPLTEHVVECKSHNQKSFDKLKKGLRQSHPDHWVQCQLYMKATGLQRCLYLAVCKNDDTLYSERIEHDRTFTKQLEKKIEWIIQSDEPPPKLFEDPNDRAAFQCGWCPARAVCHEGAWARVNCRTCIEASFLPGAVVRCNLWNKELSYDEQQRGCEKHLFLPSLVPGKQIDADEEQRKISYKLHDGSVWVDGKEQYFACLPG
jgi:hypothetical protein